MPDNTANMIIIQSHDHQTVPALTKGSIALSRTHILFVTLWGLPLRIMYGNPQFHIRASIPLQSSPY